MARSTSPRKTNPLFSPVQRKSPRKTRPLISPAARAAMVKTQRKRIIAHHERLLGKTAAKPKPLVLASLKQVREALTYSVLAAQIPRLIERMEANPRVKQKVMTLIQQINVQHAAKRDLETRKDQIMKSSFQTREAQLNTTIKGLLEQVEALLK